MDTPAGLRERKKMATRMALHEAALRLAVDGGLENLTVEAICEAADVSRRTFSNHFGSKEEALLYGDRTRMRRFVELVRMRPRGESPWEALTKAVTETEPEGLELDPEWVARMRLIRQHITLSTHQAATFAAGERELASELATRMATPDALRARLLAASALTAMRVAAQHWMDQPCDNLDELRVEALRLVAEPFD